jgi:putative acetyltransferase
MIRRATAADAEAVAQRHIAVRKACLPYLPNMHSPEAVHAFFRDRVFLASEVWVAAAEALEGFCAFRPGWVDHLYIRPECHRRGLGTALLGKAMAVNTHLQLWAFQRNINAIRFYRTRGFRVIRETDGSRNDEREPDMLMEWSA